MQHALIAFTLHRGAPSIEARPLEEEVRQRAQTHSAAWLLDVRHDLRLASLHASAYHARQRKIDLQLHAPRFDFDHGLADQFTEAGLARLGFERRTSGVVQVPGGGHALDHELTMACDVHLDATRYAQAPRTRRRFVGARQCILQLVLAF